MGTNPQFGTDLSAQSYGLTATPSSDDQFRANSYGLLAALFASPPAAELVDLLRQIEDPTPNHSESTMGAAWKMLKLASEGATVESLDDEFHDLFIGVGRGELVPYGSWYMTGFMMDKPLADLRADLARLGIERQEGVCEPEDHVSALCEAMAVLVTSGNELPFSTQQRFFNEHVGPWMGAFFRDLQTAKSAYFYRTVGRLGELFIDLERNYLAMPT
jgi:TorA maturation chaperone TorD